MLINCNNGIIVKSYEVIQTSDFVILLTYWVGNDSGQWIVVINIMKLAMKIMILEKY